MSVYCVHEINYQIIELKWRSSQFIYELNILYNTMKNKLIYLMLIQLLIFISHQSYLYPNTSHIGVADRSKQSIHSFWHKSFSGVKYGSYQKSASGFTPKMCEKQSAEEERQKKKKNLHLRTPARKYIFMLEYIQVILKCLRFLIKESHQKILG